MEIITLNDSELYSIATENYIKCEYFLYSETTARIKMPRNLHYFKVLETI